MIQRVLFLVCLGCVTIASAQNKSFSLDIELSMDEAVQPMFKSDGRLFIFITTNPKSEPSHNIWPNFYTKSDYIFAKNFHWNSNKTLVIKNSKDWDSWNKSGECSLDLLPQNTYYVQVVWQQNFETFTLTAEDNLRSKTIKVDLNSAQKMKVKLEELNQRFELQEHPLINYEHVTSDILSKWWNKPIQEHVGVLLPSQYYKNPKKEYPIYYYIGGGDSDCRYLSLQMQLSKDFANWWMSEDAPQIIIVYLDGTQNRNFYHIDSENLGAHGESLIKEVIPFVEKKYRNTSSATTRFVGGCSTGGYASLALQLFYPETFNGAYSFSPDPISFTSCLYTNIYTDDNYFVDDFGYTKMFNELGRTDNPIAVKDWIAFENVLGRSGTYLDANHGNAISALIFSPKGENGQAMPLFDAFTGEIDHQVAEAWSTYDLNKYIQNHWQTIGKSLVGKIYISSNERDDYFLDRAVRVFESTLQQLENPSPNATVDWVPGNGHCHAYKVGAPHMVVMQMIEEKVRSLELGK
ncbi:MAG: hypothetical protein RLZ33_503 [Bacteroidota bacterium]|jgi:enterochelin esterase-like enzyme